LASNASVAMNDVRGVDLKKTMQTRLVATLLAPSLVVLCLLAPGNQGVLAAADAFDQHLERIRQLNVSGQAEPARQLLDQARAILAQSTPDQQVEYQLLLAHNLGLRGDLARALESLDELLTLELTALQRMRAMAQGANIASVARQHERAFAYLREALILEPDVEQALYRSYVLGVAAQMLAGAGEHKRAIEYGQRAVTLADRSGVLREQCVARQRLAATLQLGEQTETLAETLNDAMSHCQRASDPVFRAALNAQHGRLLLQQGELDAAESLLRQSLDLSEQIDFRHNIPSIQINIAKIYSQRGQLSEAARLATEQLEPLNASRRWQELVSAHELLARHHELQGDFSRALAHMNSLLEARTRLIERERARRLAYLKVAYDLSARDQEIALLREQATASALSERTLAQRTRMRQLSYSAGMIVSALLLILLIRTSRERRHFRRLSQRDSLTGLLNHTRFFEETAAAIEQARMRGNSLCLILADIDHFKKINDQFGHLVGDQVLRRVAARMREQFPEPALLGRIGGEEFALALPDCDQHQAGAQIDSLRKLINQTRSGEGETQVTMSFGLAILAGAESLEALRRRADQALYQAKREGRDRLIVAGPDVD
jgi:diguanylate cyclase (GGDEF)-like protein